MNIFDMILKNAPSREVLFSSIYNYLIDPSETHGMGYLFFNRIMENLPGEEKKLKEFISSINGSGYKIQAVIPEKNLGKDDNRNKYGSIDSYIECGSDEDNEQTFIIGTEVKILDGSSKNTHNKKNGEKKEQLEDYYEALSKVAEENSGSKQNFILIYLVADKTSFQCLHHFNRIKAKKNTYILFWREAKVKNNEVFKPYENYSFRKTIEEIISDILLDELTGKINPISTEIKYVLKSLKLTLNNNFMRDEKAHRDNRFPDLQEFLDALSNDEARIFELLNKNSLVPLKVSRANTSIGVPYIIGDGRLKNNTLFRILTCNNYYTDIDEKEKYIVDRLVIELDQEIYEDEISEITNIFNGSVDSEIGVHPNGSDNQNVILLKFKKGQTALVNEEHIQRLYDKAREIFKVKGQ